MGFLAFLALIVSILSLFLLIRNTFKKETKDKNSGIKL
jgi:hypothetical protein